METTLGVLTYNLLSMKYVLIIAYLLVALLAIAIKTNVHGFAVCDFMVAQVSATQNWLSNHHESAGFATHQDWEQHTHKELPSV